MTLINGVDFSTAVADRNTWLFPGSLDGNILLLEQPQPIRRAPLLRHLLDIDATAVVAIDLSFGFPEPFLDYIAIDETFQSITDIWPVVAATDWQQLTAAATGCYVAHGGEVRRVAEQIHRESMSTLHRDNPDMLSITHSGAGWLTDWLDQNKRIPWYVPPMDPLPDPEEEAGILIETMPGAFLASIGLPHQGYKQNGPANLRRRDLIINQLAPLSGIELPNLDEWSDTCRRNTDCLDALVAAVCAAAFRSQTLDFRFPNHLEEAAARREGWIYAATR